MTNHKTLHPLSKRDYCGRILHGPYSENLKKRVAECVSSFRAFDNMGCLVIPYIAAWHEEEKVIWYEFVSRRLVRILGCEYSQAAETFRSSILERRIYKSLATDRSVEEEVLSHQELSGSRGQLRKEVKERGIIEAVYKSSPQSGKIFWFKDQAAIESFEQDRINISLGCLTIVSKEMEADDARKRIEKALRKSEEKFRELSIRDNLTGLFNTRYLYQSLSELIEVSKTSNSQISLIFMDLDHFKEVVDTYGHLNGSRAIQQVASTIRESLEDPAHAVAYAGDEFVVILPGFDQVNGKLKAEEIRSRIMNTVYLLDQGIEVHLGVSFGIATFPEDATDLTSLLATADRELFSVKQKRKEAV